MDRIIPWTELAAAVHTAYPKVSESGGRPPIPLERMLRIYLLQLWFNLSDPSVEEGLYDSVAMRGFVGIDLGVEGAPDETTQDSRMSGIDWAVSIPRSPRRTLTFIHASGMPRLAGTYAMGIPWHRVCSCARTTVSYIRYRIPFRADS